MSEINLRKVNLSDLEALCQISVDTFCETFSEVNTEEDMQKYMNENLGSNKLKAELENPGSEFYFAEKDANVLGYLKMNFGQAQTESLEENAYEIERIYVLKAFHGMKLGQLLFDKALAIGREREMEFVWLGVWEKNHRALRFYEKNGFEVFGKHDFVLGTDHQTDLLMKKML